MDVKVTRFTNKQLEEVLEKELDKCQKLVDKYYPLLGDDLKDHFDYIRNTIRLLSRNSK